MNLLLKLNICGLLLATTLLVKAIENENKYLNPVLKSNSGDTIHRPIQISFVPYFGTNGFVSDSIITDLSINILAGYVYEVRACEVGTILNIVKHNASSCQIAGVGNIVLGKMKGFQASGTINVAGSVDGMQATGVVNTTNYLKGMQIAGCVNNALKGNGSQISGIANHAGNSADFQIAGVANNTIEAHQFQISGVVNNAKTVDGFQLAGLVNNAIDSSGFQISGLVNNSPDVNSFQIGGLVNNAKIVNGFQISGLVNHAKIVKGMQIGIVNVADSCTLPIGILNFVKGGYHKLELSADEMFYTNVAYRSGVEAFHGIVTAGMRPENFKKLLWSYGIGCGTSFKLSNKMILDLDYTFHHVIVSDAAGSNFLQRIYVGTDWHIMSKSSIFFGITYNFFESDIKDADYTSLYSNLPNYTFTNHTWNRLNLKTWAGFRIGIRFF